MVQIIIKLSIFCCVAEAKTSLGHHFLSVHYVTTSSEYHKINSTISLKSIYYSILNQKQLSKQYLMHSIQSSCIVTVLKLCTTNFLSYKYLSCQNNDKKPFCVGWSSQEPIKPGFSITILSSSSVSNGSYNKVKLCVSGTEKGLWQTPFCTSLDQLFALLSHLTQPSHVSYDKCRSGYTALWFFNIKCISALGRDTST